MLRRCIALASILLLGLGLRLWGFWNVVNQLEYIEMMEALRICAGRPNMNRWVKRGFCYLLAVEYGGYYGLCRAAGLCKNPTDFAKQVVRDPRPLLFISRLTNVALSTLALWLCYGIARLGGPPGRAYWGALFAAVCPALVGLAHVGSVDTLLLVLVLGVLLLALRIVYRGPSRRGYFFMGLFLALACWTKTQGLLIAPCIVLAHIWSQRQLGHGWRAALSSRLLLAGAMGLLVGLVIGNPTVLLAPGAWASHLLLQAKVYLGIPLEVTAEPLTIPFSDAPAIPTYFLGMAMSELGLPICLLAALGVAIGIKRRDMSRICITLGALVFCLATGLSGSRYIRSPHQGLYYLTLLCILAGAGMAEVLNWLGSKWRPVGGAAVLVCAISVPLLKSTNIVLALSGTNTRRQAELWIRDNIPMGSKILMDSGKRVNTFAPDIPESRENILQTMQEVREALASYGQGVDPFGGKWDSDSLIYYEYRLATVPEKTYDITSTKLGRELRPLDYYRQCGFQYIITCSDVKDRIQGEHRDRFPEGAEFYDALDAPGSPARLLATFHADRFHKGPTFGIYALEPAERR